MIQIVRIAPSDTDQLQKLFAFRYRTYIEQHKMFLPSAEMLATKQEFDLFDEHSIHFVALEDDNIVGCVRVVPDTIGLPVLIKSQTPKTDNKSAEIGRLMVEKRLKGSIIAMRLMKAAFDETLQDYELIFTDVFRGDITHKILKRMGFEEAGVEYEDESFLATKPSVILFFNKTTNSQTLRRFHSWLGNLEKQATSAEDKLLKKENKCLQMSF